MPPSLRSARWHRLRNRGAVVVPAERARAALAPYLAMAAGTAAHYAHADDVLRVPRALLAVLCMACSYWTGRYTSRDGIVTTTGWCAPAAGREISGARARPRRRARGGAPDDDAEARWFTRSAAPTTYAFGLALVLASWLATAPSAPDAPAWLEARAPLAIVPALMTSRANAPRATDRAGDERLKVGTCVPCRWSRRSSSRRCRRGACSSKLRLGAARAAHGAALTLGASFPRRARIARTFVAREALLVATSSSAHSARARGRGARGLRALPGADAAVAVAAFAATSEGAARPRRGRRSPSATASCSRSCSSEVATATAPWPPETKLFPLCPPAMVARVLLQRVARRLPLRSAAGAREGRSRDRRAARAPQRPPIHRRRRAPHARARVRPRGRGQRWKRRRRWNVPPRPSCTARACSARSPPARRWRRPRRATTPAAPTTAATTRWGRRRRAASREGCARRGRSRDPRHGRRQFHRARATVPDERARRASLSSPPYALSPRALRS